MVASRISAKSVKVVKPISDLATVHVGSSMAEELSSLPAAKKRKVLSVEDKLEVLKLIDSKTSYSTIAGQYGIGKSTVSDIKKNRIKLVEQFKKKTVEMGMKTANIKAMKFGEHKELDGDWGPGVPAGTAAVSAMPTFRVDTIPSHGLELQASVASTTQPVATHQICSLLKSVKVVKPISYLATVQVGSSMAEELSSLPAAKKRKVLSVEDKLEVLKLIDSKTSYSTIAGQYGIGKSTVGDIKKNRIKLVEQFKKKTVEMGMKTANIKAMKFGEHKELDGDWGPGVPAGTAAVSAMPTFRVDTTPSHGLELLASVALSSYNPTASLPPKLVKKILDLEFVEMAELCMDGDLTAPNSRPPPNPPGVTNISVWVERFAIMAAILATTFPDKAPEFLAYMAIIVRAERNYDGDRWAVYDRQFRREALARKDLNWSVTNPRLYSEAFTGRARCIARCGFCLRDDHMTQTCPCNPNSSTQAWGQESPAWPQPTPLLSQQPLGSQPQEICWRSDSRAAGLGTLACLSCGGAHPQRDCTQRTTRGRSRSPNRSCTQGQQGRR